VSATKDHVDQVAATVDRLSTVQKFELVTATEIIARLKSPKWLVRNYLPENALGQLYGESGFGKTFVALDLALCCSSGLAWHGQSVKHGPVIYVAGEGHAGLGRRVLAWSLHHKIPVENMNFFASKTPTALVDLLAALQVTEAVADITKERHPHVMIVIDTLARNFGPGDESANADMSMCVEHIDQLRQEFGCTVLIVHHVGHAEKNRSRGASCLRGALDFELQLNRSDDVLELLVRKQKDAPEAPPRAFRQVTIELPLKDDEGEAVTSIALESANYAPPAERQESGLGKKEQAMLQLLREMHEQHRANIEADGGDRDPYVEMRHWREEGIKKQIISDTRQTFYKVKDSLLKRGMIKSNGALVWIPDA
jgi:hypothetical protein